MGIFGLWELFLIMVPGNVIIWILRHLSWQVIWKYLTSTCLMLRPFQIDCLLGPTDPDFLIFHLRIHRVVILSNERLVDLAHTVPLIAFILLIHPLPQKHRSSSHKNALKILMQNAGWIVLSPASVSTTASFSSCDEQLRGDQRLRNDCLQYLLDWKAGWNPVIVSGTGDQFVRTMTSALGYPFVKF